MKFACLGLAKPFSSWVDSRGAEVFYLASLPGQLRNNPKWQVRYGANVLSSAVSMIEPWRVLDVDLDQAFLQTLTTIPGIDAGEAAIYASLTRLTDALVLTGDKRCLRALAGVNLPAAYSAKINGLTICFEQILEHMIKEQGYAQILQTMTRFEECDKTVGILFSQGQASKETEVLAGLASYINHEKSQSPGVLRDAI